MELKPRQQGFRSAVAGGWEPWGPEVARRGKACWSEPSADQPRAPPETVIREPFSVLPLEPVTRLTGHSFSSLRLRS
jgi:hypothetical protein